MLIGTPYASIEIQNSKEVFKDCNSNRDLDESEFAKNFLEVAPVLFCFSAEKDSSLAMIRDKWISDEICRTRTCLVSLNKEISSLSKEDVNIYHLSTTLKMFQDRINILKALRYPSTDKNTLKFNIEGTRKLMKVDISKFLESVTIEQILTEEEREEQKRQQKIQEKNQLKMHLSAEDHSYLAQKLKEFEIKLDRGLLDSPSMLKVMKLISDFAKTKNEIVTMEAQSRRLSQYGKNDRLYIDTIKETLAQEEANYNYCTNAVLFKAKIAVGQYAASEKRVFSDPNVQLDLIQQEKDTTDFEIEVPELLTKDAVIELVKKANDVAFENYRKLIEKVEDIDRALAPIVIS